MRRWQVDRSTRVPNFLTGHPKARSTPEQWHSLNPPSPSSASAQWAPPSLAPISQPTTTLPSGTPTRPVIKELVEKGVAFVPGLADAINASPITVFNLVGYDALNSTLNGIRSKDIGGVLKGKYIVNLTTGSPNQAREMAEWMLNQEAVGSYVDGGIMATPEMIGTPASNIFVSGAKEADVSESVKAAIAVVGKPIWFGEDAGAASLHDLAMLAGMYGMFGGAMTAMGILSKAAKREEEAGSGDGKVQPKVSALLETTIQELLPLLDMLAKDMDEGNLEAKGFPMEMQRIALQKYIEGL